MTAPASYDRVLAVLRRLSPPWPSTDSDKAVGKELGAIATSIGTATDPLDGVLDEIFPDTTTELIERWEKVCRIAPNTTIDIATRRTNVLSVLRRTGGPRIDQLITMLAGPLSMTDPNEIDIIETFREEIEAALTITIESTLTAPVTPDTLKIPVTRPWPGTVDDFGVAFYIDTSSALGWQSATLTSPAGTIWTVPIGIDGWYSTRTDFLDEPAGGTWVFQASRTAAPATISEFRLLVSNSIDSGHIYNMFAFADPDLSGTQDIAEAQRLLHRTALAQMSAFVVASLFFTHGEALHGREPHGVDS